VVCPGSRIDGKSYTIARDVRPLPLPANVKEALAKVPEQHPDWNKWMCEPDNDREIARAIEWLKSLDPIPEGYRNTDGFHAACVLKDLGLTAQTSASLMLEHWPSDLDDDEIEDLCRNAHKSGQRPPGCDSLEAFRRDCADIFSDPDLKKRQWPVLSPKKPYVCAQELIARRYTKNDLRTLHRSDGQFLHYAGTHYEAADDETIRGATWAFLHHAWKVVKEDEKEVQVRFDPKKNIVSDVFDAALAQTELEVTSLPCWAPEDGEDRPPATEMLACRNGLLHLPTRKLYPHTPAFIGLNALPYDYDPKAGPPKELLKFLASIWGTDTECIALLQQWLGYVLSGDTKQHKILLLIGAPRGGKGVILRLARALIGEANVCGPTLSSLPSQFGLEPLIGKQLATISDARLSKVADTGVIVERLLSISGEDPLTVARKFKPAWDGRLATRFMMATNQALRLTDAAGALVSRLLVLPFRQSFLNREDHELEARLTAELPAVLNWALDGLAQLKAERRFVQPRSGQQHLDVIKELTAAVDAFTGECCESDLKATVATADLYHAYRRWCDAKGSKPLAENAFGAELLSAVPGIGKDRRMVNGERKYVYTGLILLPEWAVPEVLT
jgi:putative DNA primase/helicase